MTQTQTLRPFDRLLPLSGVAFTVLMVAGAAAFPMPPGGDISPASQPAWLAAHSAAVIAQCYVRALAAVAFLGLAAAVAAAIRRSTAEFSSQPAAALLGGSLTGAMLLLAQAVGLAAALLSRGGGATDAVRALGQLQDAVLNLSSLPAVLLFAAVGTESLRTGLLPRWLTVVTMIGVPFALLDAASFDTGPFASVGLIGLFFFLTWSLLVGIRLALQNRGRSAAAEQRAATAAA